MMDRFRRWIALCLCLCLMVSNIAVVGFAAEEPADNSTIQTEGDFPVQEDPDDVQDEPDDSEDDQDNSQNDIQEEPDNTPDDSENDSDDVHRDLPETEQEQYGICDVPLYLQTDYADVPYGDGTIATSGCSMVCIAMVISYLTGQKVLPDTIAKTFTIPGISNTERMEAAADAYYLEYTKTYSTDDVAAALAEGKVVIAMLDSSSVFTNSQHLVVLSGWLPGERIWVNDPMGDNYQRAELQDGYKNGFPRDQVFHGFSGAWIFEPYSPPPDTTTPSDAPVTSQWAQTSEKYIEVPLLLQTDYANVPYGDGTVATSGCSMACAAMVITALTGQRVMPDTLAKMFRTADGSHVQRMEAAALIHDLEFSKTLSLKEVLNALGDGKIVVIMLDRKSDFTSTQHLVVLTRLLPNGKIMVNDPLGSNYVAPKLKDGFQNGFTTEHLFTGFSGAWIFEPYSPPEPSTSNYSDVKLTQDETDLLAKLIWREARGESLKGQQAVAEVVLNRLISGKYDQHTISGLIMAPGQFNTAKFLDVTTADPLQYKAIEKALNGPNVLPTDVYHFSRYQTTSTIWGRIGKHVFY